MRILPRRVRPLARGVLSKTVLPPVSVPRWALFPPRYKPPGIELQNPCAPCSLKSSCGLCPTWHLLFFRVRQHIQPLFRWGIVQSLYFPMFIIALLALVEQCKSAQYSRFNIVCSVNGFGLSIAIYCIRRNRKHCKPLYCLYHGKRFLVPLALLSVFTPFHPLNDYATASLLRRVVFFCLPLERPDKAFFEQ